MRPSSATRLQALIAATLDYGPRDPVPDDLDDCADDGFEYAWELMLAAREPPQGA